MDWCQNVCAITVTESHPLILYTNIHIDVTKVVRFNSTREDGRRAWDENDPAWTDIMPGT